MDTLFVRDLAVFRCNLKAREDKLQLCSLVLVWYDNYIVQSSIESNRLMEWNGMEVEDSGLARVGSGPSMSVVVGRGSVWFAESWALPLANLIAAFSLAPEIVRTAGAHSQVARFRYRNAASHRLPSPLSSSRPLVGFSFSFLFPSHSRLRAGHDPSATTTTTTATAARRLISFARLSAYIFIIN